MTEPPKPFVLRDFLYRDMARLESYYAQISRARPEPPDEDAAAPSRTGGWKSAASALFERSEADEERVPAKPDAIATPDLVTLAVLSFLSEKGYVAEHPNPAPRGSIVRSTGTVAFADRALIEASLADAADAAPRPVSQEDAPAAPADGRTVRAGLEALAKGGVPSVFTFETDDHDLITGTVKGEGLEEPISGYYLRHGEKGLSGVTLIGVKEEGCELFRSDVSEGVRGVQRLGKVVGDYFAAALAVRVTPLVIYRELAPAAPREEAEEE